MPAEEYNKLSVTDKAKLHRFVLCLNKLSNCINKKSALTSNIQDTINIVGSHEFVITADLMDSFNQRMVQEDHLPFIAFHSPIGDNYVFLRSPQGLLPARGILHQQEQTGLQEPASQTNHSKLTTVNTSFGSPNSQSKIPSCLLTIQYKTSK